MRASTAKRVVLTALLTGLLIGAGAPEGLAAPESPAVLPAPPPPPPAAPGGVRSIAESGPARAAGWTTPPALPRRVLASESAFCRTVERVAADVTPPPPPPPVRSDTIGPTWSSPAPEPVSPSASSAPCPPPTPPVCPPAAPAVVPERTWSGCRLPCEDKISMWHVRALGGPAFYFGDDAPEDCTYLGADLGRTFCGCWGLDLFYRTHWTRFEREEDRCIEKDGGYFHHVGAKLTWERSWNNNSRFYYWIGLGASYYWTEDFYENDKGVSAFGEAGLGYVISRNLRVRAGVNVHGMDTDVTRRDPADIGQSRWLWVVAPVLEVEVDW